MKQKKEIKIKLTDYFKKIDDPRKKHLIRHQFIDIITIAICAVISGADHWNDIEEYGKMKEKWLRKFLLLPEGIPSHDTFRKVFSNLDPEQFKISFLDWVKSISQLTKEEIISIDGKTARRSGGNGKNPLHIVSAWAQQNNLVLGQIKTEEKSNEITAIPKLLDILSIKGCITTIDAMGCQKDIAKKIIEKESDYILALKGNQGNIYKQVKKIFEKKLDKIDYNSCEKKEKNRGRIETRKCTSIILSDQNIELEGASEWTELKSIIRIESKQEHKNKTTEETRYYISSLKKSAEEFNEFIRKHWSIENSLHWVLDIAFREDESRIRKGNSGENFSIMRHIALNLLKQEKSLKRGIKGKRLVAGWNNDYLLKILNI